MPVSVERPSGTTIKKIAPLSVLDTVHYIMNQPNPNSLRIRLPLCPSVNSLYFNRSRGAGRGRIRTARYRKWLREADSYLLAQKHWKVPGEVSIEIRTSKLRGDANNYIKAICDYLVSRELTDDDRLHTKVSIEVDPWILDGLCRILIMSRRT